MLFRRGQWVKTRRELRFGDVVEPKGTIGIHIGHAHIRENPDAERSPHATLREVHLVHPSSGERREMIAGDVVTTKYRGGDTRRVVAIDEQDLLAAQREDIPADRLKTMSKDWKPVTDNQPTE